MLNEKIRNGILKTLKKEIIYNLENKIFGSNDIEISLDKDISEIEKKSIFDIYKVEINKLFSTLKENKVETNFNGIILEIESDFKNNPIIFKNNYFKEINTYLNSFLDFLIDNIKEDLYSFLN
jgi:hypothetical protein